jgi:hypothetical protein
VWQSATGRTRSSPRPNGVDALRGLIRPVVFRGMERGEIRPRTDPGQVATVLTATMEGAVMLRQLYQDPTFAVVAGAHRMEYVDGQRVSRARGPPTPRAPGMTGER